MTMFPHRGIVADLCNSLFPMGLRNTETRYFVLWGSLLLSLGSPSLSSLRLPRVFRGCFGCGREMEVLGSYVF